MQDLRRRLSKEGITRNYLNECVLPDWWSDGMASTPAGLQEAAGILSARLGFTLESLLKSGASLKRASFPGVRYKRSVRSSNIELATRLSLSTARMAAQAWIDQPKAGSVPEAVKWRDALREHSNKPWVCFEHILAATWELGIPVLSVQNLPRGSKKPDALTTVIDERPVIVIMNSRKSPSWLAFIIAHELGHIHEGHIKSGETLIDEKIDEQAVENEEYEANRYAAKLLTGQTDLGLHSTRRLTGEQLAQRATRFGEKYQVAPGVAALNYGFTTNWWPVANRALQLLEGQDDAQKQLRSAISRHLHQDQFSEDAWMWLSCLMRLSASE